VRTSPSAQGHAGIGGFRQHAPGALGLGSLRIPADVTRADDIEKVIDQTVNQLGAVDVLVNNAGDDWLMHYSEREPL
jgi:NAD(P)-dependent dehydrogenase (short-subunit alcohol dehydrogenase family)